MYAVTRYVCMKVWHLSGNCDGAGEAGVRICGRGHLSVRLCRIRRIGRPPDVEKERGDQSMKIAVLRIRLYAPWVHSLKEKRMVVKSLLAKIRNKFQVSAAEVEDQDIHQSIVIGVAAIVPHKAQADSMMEEIAGFVEQNTEAEIVEEGWEMR